jgi:NADPH:quinone reductase
MAAIQLGKAMGARVIATAGSAAKIEFSRAQGADHVLDYSGGDWADKVKKITGERGADVIYDPVGGEIFDLSTKCIAPEGRLLVIGFASGRIPSPPLNRVLLKDISIVGVHWGPYARQHPEYFAEAQRTLSRMFDERKVSPVVGARYAFEDAPLALHDLAGRRMIGKAVLINAL